MRPRIASVVAMVVGIAMQSCGGGDSGNEGPPAIAGDTGTSADAGASGDAQADAATSSMDGSHGGGLPTCASPLIVTPTTASYPGAPLAVNVFDVTLTNCQHALFDADLCRTFAWEDVEATSLAPPKPVGANWPPPDITMFVNYPNTLDAVNPWGDGADTWSNWSSSPWRPKFLGKTSDLNSVTFTCDMPNGPLYGGPSARHTLSVTYRSESRPAGDGYSIVATVDPKGAAQGIGWVTNQRCVGAVRGSSDGLAAWVFDGDGYGIEEYPWVQNLAIGNGRSQFWVVITHPAGAFTLMQPNLYDIQALNGWDIQSDGATPGFLAGKSSGGTSPAPGQFASDPVAFLWRRGPNRTVPQKYLDARFSMMKDWMATLGVGPQALSVASEAGGGGDIPWANFKSIDSYTGQYGLAAWGARTIFMQNILEMFNSSGPGDPSTINRIGSLDPDEYYPSASDLPGLTQPNDRSFSLGTLAEMRDGMDVARAMGMRASYWSQWGYHGDCPGSPRAASSTEWSRFDASWPCSYFFKEHPELAYTDPADGRMYADFTNPGFYDWMKDWQQKYWFYNGVVGRFIDTNQQVPEVGNPAFPKFMNYYVWTMRQGGFIWGENPEPFFGPLYYNQGSPFAIWGREWGAPFAIGSPRYRNCLGVANASTDACNVVISSTGGPLAGTYYEPASARRIQGVAGGLSVGGIDRMMDFLAHDSDPGFSGYSTSVKNTALHAGAMQDRFGVPDRVELVNPRPMPSTPYPIVLAEALQAGPLASPIYEPDEVWVSPIYQLPIGGRIQIDSEIIAYTQNSSDSGLNSGISGLFQTTRGWQGTAAAPHAFGATILSLDDQMHWDFDDVYWVYGQTPNEVWVKFSDGSVWKQGGQAPAALPQISNVNVTFASGTATVTFTTDVPCSAWIEYDSYGAADQYISARPKGWWPAYKHKTNLDDTGPPAPATSHSRALSGLTAGSTYHYRIVARGPAQNVTDDATFVAQQP